MSTTTPFKIDVPEFKIRRLKQKLALTDFPSDITDAAPWSQGVPLPRMKQLAGYWEHKFDWRAAERRLNEFSQFMTKIEVDGFGTYDLHFIHQQSSVKMPYLFSSSTDGQEASSKSPRSYPSW